MINPSHAGKRGIPVPFPPICLPPVQPVCSPQRNLTEIIVEPSDRSSMVLIPARSRRDNRTIIRSVKSSKLSAYC